MRLRIACEVANDDEALGGDAALPGVHAARERGGAGRRFHVSVGKHDKRIRPAQFQNGLLQRSAGRRDDRPTRPLAAGQRDGGEQPDAHDHSATHRCR